MIANTIEPPPAVAWLLLREPDAAEPLARALMGTSYVGKRVELDGAPRLAVADAPAFRHRLAQPTTGGLAAVDRMRLRGLVAVAEETTDPGERA